MPNEVLRLLADVLPVLLVERVLSSGRLQEQSSRPRHRSKGNSNAHEKLQYLAGDDLLDELRRALGRVLPGRIAAQEDVNDHAQRPHVHGLVVRLALYHLRRDVHCEAYVRVEQSFGFQ